MLTLIAIAGMVAVAWFTPTKESSGSEQDKNPASSQSNEIVISPTTTPLSTPAPAVVEKYNIEVTSIIVKRIENKYRYFFDIRNNDTKSFEGSVYISLHTKSAVSPWAEDTFIAQSPIEPGLGKSVYVEGLTGPESQNGPDYGLSSFKYTAMKEGQEVANGEGIITAKFENTN